MIPRTFLFKALASVSVAALLWFSAVAFAEGRLDHSAPRATAATSVPPMADAGSLGSTPPFLAGLPGPLAPAGLSSTLSYYFISAMAFTPANGTAPYLRQGSGCVNQMPLGTVFSAPVQLPQASQVVSITLYSYDSAITTTVSSAFFIVNDGKGGGGYTVSANSQANVAGYQQNSSSQNNPTTVDYQNYNYFVNWFKTGDADSQFLSLCGVRVAYYAPLGPAAYLSIISK